MVVSMESPLGKFNRKHYWKCRCYVTRVIIPTPPVSSWEYWSAKDQAYALKYEVVVSLSPNQRIVWVEGPIIGPHSDLTIFRHHLKKSLTSGEKLIADKGYIGEPNHLLTARRNNTRKSRMS